MSVLPFIPKEHPELPDRYGMTFIYHDGSKEEFDVAQHKTLQNQTIEFCTKDDRWHMMPFTSFRRLDFDSRFSKVLELKEQKKHDGKIS